MTPPETDEHGIWQDAAEHRDRLAFRAAACFALGCIVVAVAVMVL
jgi:hypothetical protein